MKYCNRCNVENLEKASFCINCGTKIDDIIKAENRPVNIQTNKNTQQQYYGQPYPYPLQPSSKNKKPIIAIIVICIATAIIIASLFISGVFTGGGSNNFNINKIPVAGGPRGNLQSLATGGNALTTPDIFHTAVYGYYMNGSKIGSISFTNKGEEYYLGKLCYKIEGGGIFDIQIYNQQLEMDFNINGYVTKSDLTLQYYNYEFSVGYNGYSMDMSGTIYVDIESGKITLDIYSSMIGSISKVIEVPNDFWTTTNLQDNLYVGYSNEVYYSTNVSGYNTDVSMKISVIGQEDVTVSKGTFEDCYIVKIEQTNGGTTTISYMWIDENNVCPKMQILNSSVPYGYGDLVIQLEEYYTT